MNCSKCDDSGYVDGKMCECKAHRLLARRVGEMFAGCRLESKPATKCQFVALQELRKAPKSGYFIFGVWGTGKTWLLSCLHNSLWLKHGSAVKYLTDNDLLKLTHYKNEHSLEDFIKDIKSFAVHTIFIDDICRTHYQDYNQDGIYEIINTAYITGVPLVISSNYPTEEVAKITSGAVARRIEHDTKLIKLVEVYEKNSDNVLCV